MKQFLISLKILLFFTLLTGFAYPLLVTGIAKFLFPVKSEGSIIYRNNEPVGSTLIGQKFDSLIYFFPRPSATGYNTMPSGGSNLCNTNRKLQHFVDERTMNFIAINKLDSLTIVPSEMIYASASGLDPHISINAALLQVNRIAEARNFDPIHRKELLDLINRLTIPASLLIPGEKRINVLILNLNLDDLK